VNPALKGGDAGKDSGNQASAGPGDRKVVPVRGEQGGDHAEQKGRPEFKGESQKEEKGVKLIPYDPVTSALSAETSSEFISFYQPFKSSPPCFAIDVECVATGTSHNARAVGHIALVDQRCRLLLNVYVKPEQAVVSYLEDLTGLNKAKVSKGITLEEGLSMIKKILPPNAILVGQNVAKDIEWLSLKEGVDFAGMIDLGGLWRVFNPTFKNYSYFSLQHKAKYLLGYHHVGAHTAINDALISMQLYNLYHQLEYYPAQLAFAHHLLLQNPVDESFGKKHSVYEGVCMGQRKSCKCGDPFLY